TTDAGARARRLGSCPIYPAAERLPLGFGASGPDLSGIGAPEDSSTVVPVALGPIYRSFSACRRPAAALGPILRARHPLPLHLRSDESNGQEVAAALAGEQLTGTKDRLPGRRSRGRTRIGQEVADTPAGEQGAAARTLRSMPRMPTLGDVNAARHRLRGI